MVELEGRRLRVGVAALLVCVAVGVTPPGTSRAHDPQVSAAAAKAKRCKAFSYRHRTAHVTYRFSRLTVTGAPCSVIEKVVVGYFRDKGEPAGTAPSEGYNVHGWNVLIHTSTLDGYKLTNDKVRFSGIYTLPNAAASARATPKVPCFGTNFELDEPLTFRTRPKTCSLVPKDSSDWGNGLMQMRWSSWTGKEARGRGASYRLWSDIQVRLSAPKRVCGRLVFTRAKVVYVGGGEEYWPDKVYALKTCDR